MIKIMILMLVAGVALGLWSNQEPESSNEFIKFLNKIYYKVTMIWNVVINPFCSGLLGYELGVKHMPYYLVAFSVIRDKVVNKIKFHGQLEDTPEITAAYLRIQHLTMISEMRKYGQNFFAAVYLFIYGPDGKAELKNFPMFLFGDSKCILLFIAKLEEILETKHKNLSELADHWGKVRKEVIDSIYCQKYAKQ